MSTRSSASDGGLLARLPEWARPRESERRTLKGTGGMGSLRLAETTILILVGLLLAIATVNDVAQQTHVSRRLIVDMATWRAATGRDYHNLKVEQDLRGHTTRDTVCGNLSPGGPDERAQVCLTVVGPVLSGRRAVSGGYHLPAMSADERGNRYACFGAAAEGGMCGRAAPPVPPPRTGRP